MGDFTVGNTYSFTTLAPGVLGASYTNAKVIGIVNYSVAVSITNVDYLQKVVYPLLPAGSPSNYEDYNYIIFSTSNNSKLVLAEAWINQNSINLVTGTQIDISIFNTSLSQVSALQKQLSAMGFNDFTITTSNGSSSAASTSSTSTSSTSTSTSSS